MAQHELINAKISVDTSKDNVVIDKVLETVRGGRTLDLEGFPDDVIQAGHVIFKSPDGRFVPQPTDGTIPNDGEAEPTDFTAVGILTVSRHKTNPTVGIMTRGTVNESYLKYPITDATKELLGDRIAYAITD